MPSRGVIDPASRRRGSGPPTPGGPGPSLARAGRLGRLALLAAAASSLSCGLPYVPPAAKASLRGYELKSAYSEGLAVVARASDRRLGWVDGNGRVVVPPRFVEAGLFSEGLAPAREEWRQGWGYVGRDGRFAIPPGFDAALPFSGGLAPVRLGGKWGFAGRDGTTRAPARFDGAWGFSEGLARVVVDGLAGFVDTAGAWVVAPVYFRAGDFREGLAPVCGRSLCGYVDRTGAVAIPLAFDDAGGFAEGLAPVRRGEKWGYVDRSGRFVLLPSWDEAGSFSEGLALVGAVKEASFDSKFGGYSGLSTFHGFVDARGRPAFDTVILGATPFSEGIAVIRVPAGGLCSDCDAYRLMRKDGSFLPGTWDVASPFSDGRAVVAVSGRSYVLDREGTPLVELDRSYLDEPSRAARHVADVRYGYVDAAGATALVHELTSAQPFSEGLALVEGPRERRSRNRRYVDREGRTVLPVPEGIGLALPFTDGRALFSETVEGRTAWGFLDRRGERVIPSRYASAAPFSEGLAAVKLSRDPAAADWGYVDREGRTAIEARFRAAGPFSNGLAWVERLSQERYLLPAVIDRSGRVVVEKPFLPGMSQALWGTPSVERLVRRAETSFGEGLVPVQDGAARGWADASGRLAVRGGGFRELGLFSEGRAKVLVPGGSLFHGTWGYVDRKGDLVVPARYTRAGPFLDGLAEVHDAAGRTGWITPSGQWAVEPVWLEEAGPFSSGLAPARVNGLWGYLDREGRFAIPPRFLRAAPFSEGLAATALAAPPRPVRTPPPASSAGR